MSKKVLCFIIAMIIFIIAGFSWSAMRFTELMNQEKAECHRDKQTSNEM